MPLPGSVRRNCGRGSEAQIWTGTTLETGPPEFVLPRRKRRCARAASQGGSRRDQGGWVCAPGTGVRGAVGRL